MELHLKILKENDVSQSYVNWYSDDDVIRYSDNQYQIFTLDGQCLYVENCLKDSDIDLYGIFDENLHIGNIVVNGLNSVHKRAELTYVVGESSYWGRGVAYFAVSSLVEIARSKYALNKLYAGLVENNAGSKRVLEKNGFVLEGTRLQHLFYNGEYYNQLDYGLVL
jgi:RimJ/RimL family protein N-acetyltransferase